MICNKRPEAQDIFLIMKMLYRHKSIQNDPNLKKRIIKWNLFDLWNLCAYYGPTKQPQEQ
jgi:uncharacterized protein YprB with RNaseH-like and TPR domain